MKTFIVTLRGEHVFHECSLFCQIQDISKETLEKVKIKIKERYNLEVYDFSRQFGLLNAWTNDSKVKVFIEEVYTL